MACFLATRESSIIESTTKNGHTSDKTHHSLMGLWVYLVNQNFRDTQFFKPSYLSPMSAPRNDWQSWLSLEICLFQSSFNYHEWLVANQRAWIQSHQTGSEMQNGLHRKCKRYSEICKTNQLMDWISSPFRWFREIPGENERLRYSSHNKLRETILKPWQCNTVNTNPMCK